MSESSSEEEIRRKVRGIPTKFEAELKSFFVREIVKVGLAVGMFDMATVSLGLTLQEVAHTPLVWLPISGVLYAGTVMVLSRVMSQKEQPKP